VSKLRKVEVDHACLKGLIYALWGFLMFTVILEGLEFANIVYKGKEGIDTIMAYVSGPLFFRYFVLQFGLGAILPIIIMGLMIARDVRGKWFVMGSTLCALLVLMNVLFMRWNVVIGGQEISKTGKGLMTYEMPLFGLESFSTAFVVLLAPFIVLWILTRLFPPWSDTETTSEG
jgi:predicted membrane protein